MFHMGPGGELTTNRDCWTTFLMLHKLLWAGNRATGGRFHFEQIDNGSQVVVETTSLTAISSMDVESGLSPLSILDDALFGAEFLINDMIL
jgi:hypothetical protein